MRVVTLDFETYWDAAYSLSNLSPLEYVMGNKFEAQFVSIKFDDYPTRVYVGDEIEPALRAIDWSDAAGLGHNMSGFDAYILAYRYNIHPRVWLCTLAMARPLHGNTCGVSLSALTKHYADELRAQGINPVKDNTVLLETKGRRLVDFSPQEIAKMRAYNGQDDDLCKGLFNILRKKYTSQELWQIDALVRMRTEPKFELDTALLATAHSVERSNKHKALLQLASLLRKEVPVAPEPAYDGADPPDFGADQGADFWDNSKDVAEFVRSELASATKFSAILTSLGVPVPMKPSPSVPDTIVPALAKTDEEFIALQEHDNPIVSAAARTRLAIKSTLLETRIEKFITAGKLAGGLIPIPLRYCGADTGRDSGEEYNPQNLPRVDRGNLKLTDALRRSLRAPKGYKIVAADQANIELRVNHFLWGVKQTVQLFRENPKADPYKNEAVILLRKPAGQVTKHERQIEKVKALGLGFGAGAPRFVGIAKNLGGLVFTLEESVRHVETWRARNPEIVEGWAKCARALLMIAEDIEQPVDPRGLVRTCKEGFLLPSGRVIRYPNLRIEPDGKWPDGRPKKSWFYGDGRHRTRITGPKACENIVQALARDSVFDCTLDFYRETGLRPALRVHDELLYVVLTETAQAYLDILQRIMRTPPKWWPDLVVWSDGAIADTYADAK
jgi:hypothetical protein